MKIQKFLKRVEAYSDAVDKGSNTEESAQISKALGGAAIGIDLIVFQALLSISPVDSSVENSLSALSIALPLLAAFLYIRFLQEKHGMRGYPVQIVKLFAYAGLGTTITGIYYAIKHVSLHASNLFACTCIILITFIILMNYRSFAINQSKGISKPEEEKPDL